MKLRPKKKLDKYYKYKDLKVYSSTEWLAEGKKKYRRVFENKETSYLYAELSFYNKLFDEEDWDTEVVLKCFRLKTKAKREELCSIDIQQRVSMEENIIYVREGWGNQSSSSFWTRGDYSWEAYIDGELVGTTIFYVEEGANDALEEELNPYFEIDSAHLYEGPSQGVPVEAERKHCTHFDASKTRYIWADFRFTNLQYQSWYCELIFNFYNDAGQLKGRTYELKNIHETDEQVSITTGWGSNTEGTWYADTYTLEVIFMDKLVAVVPFEVGTEFVEGESPLLIGADIDFGLPLENNSEPNEPLEKVMSQLEELIGLNAVKERVKDYIHYLKFLKLRKEQGFEEKEPISLHSVFKGNPGTGKTTVAKLVGKLYHKMGLLSKGKVHEVGRAELIGQYIGQTAPKVKEMIEKARGGVLFIDEAYSLVRSNDDSKDYGQEVIETLIKEMSDGKGDLAIIMAGYPKEMDVMLNSNPGLKSRINLYFDFEDYLPAELFKIIDLASQKREIEFAPDAQEFLYKKLTDAYRERDESFGNARLVYSLVDEAKMNMGLRVVKNLAPDEVASQEMLKIVSLADVKPLFKSGKRKSPNLGVDEELLEEAMTELNQLIGLTEVKNEIHELTQLVKFYRETGKDVMGRFFLHAIFKGNPGTGKTTVARIVSKMYKALGILERGHIVECDRQALVAGFVGQTATKTKAMIDKAIGGVLFIDEAYSLGSPDINGNDFGKEAVEIILKQMEDRRGEFIVIVAGYPDNMNRFMEINPGLKSRFDKTLNFEDFSADDLFSISLAMLEKEGLNPDLEAAGSLRQYFKYLHERRDKYFGNARSVRKMIDKAVKNQHLRMAALPKAERTETILATLTINDVKEFHRDNEEMGDGQSIGFRPTIK